MTNKNFLLVFISFIFIFLIGSCGASVQASFDAYYSVIESDGSITHTTIPVSGFDVEGYLCANADCTVVGVSVSGLTASTSTSNIIIDFPTNLQSQYGYLLYFYKDGYIGMERSGIIAYGTGPWDAPDTYLYRKAIGWAPVMNMSVVNEVLPNTPIEIGVSIGVDADTYAAIDDSRYSNVPLNEEVETLVTFEIVNSDGVVVYIDSRVLSIGYSGVETVSFNYAGFGVGEEGEYDFVIYTDVTDAKILNSVRQSSVSSLTVLEEDANDYWYTLISGLRMSPVVPEIDDLVTFDFGYSSVYVNDIFIPVNTEVEVEFFKDSFSMGIDYYDLSSALEVFSFSNSFSQAGNYTVVVSGFPAGAPESGGNVSASSEEISFIVSEFVIDIDWDGDGYNNTVDCDDNDSSVWQNLTGYTDFDGDGFGSGSFVVVCSGVNLPSGYVADGSDCDDGDVAVNPGALEICGDGVDNDCDGLVDGVGCASGFVAVANASPLSGYSPLDVSFSCQGAGGNGTLNYFWDFDNGDYSSVQNPNYTYLDVGDFNASCQVRNSIGNATFGYVMIDVNGGDGDNFDDDVCNPKWECFAWSDCIGGFEDRTCVDTNTCRTMRNKPVELMACTGSDNIINIGSSFQKGSKISAWVIVSLILLFLILLLSVSVFLLRRK